MALTTQCPHCGAAFKVVADQLRIRDGLVRCGVCTAVFDGRANLQGTTGVAATPTPVSVSNALPASSSGSDDFVPAEPSVMRGRDRVQRVEMDFSEAPVVMRTRADYPTYSDTVAAPGEGDVAWRGSEDPEAYAEGRQAEQLAPGNGFGSASGEYAARSAYLADEADEDDSRDASPTYETEHRSAVVEEAAAHHTPIFGEIRSGRGYREPQWNDPAEQPVGDESAGRPMDAAGVIRGEPRTRYVDDPHSGRLPPEFMDEAVSQRQQTHAFGWGIASIALLLVLVVMSIYVYRTQLATAVPALRPALEVGCRALGCSVGYERRIERISIMSSSLTPPQGTVSQAADRQNLVLQMVMRNRFNAPQHWPAITLELNDLSDTVVVRKTILPAQYLTAEQLAAPFGPNAEQRIRLPLTVSGVQVNGYQLDKFFP